MGQTVEIPGGTAVLRGKEELRGRDRTLVKAAFMAASNALDKLPKSVMDGKREDETQEQAVLRLSRDMAGVALTWQESLALLEVRQATVVALLESWTLDRPLPTMATIGDLPGDLYDALDEAIGGVAGLASGVNFEPTPDEESPTRPSGASSGGLRGEESSSATISQPQSDGGSTATALSSVA